jgi:hypothetical protein
MPDLQTVATTTMTVADLRRRFKAICEATHQRFQNYQIRVHRALSWLERSQDLDTKEQPDGATSISYDRQILVGTALVTLTPEALNIDASTCRAVGRITAKSGSRLVHPGNSDKAISSKGKPCQANGFTRSTKSSWGL